MPAAAAGDSRGRGNTSALLAALRQQFPSERLVTDPTALQAWDCDGFTLRKQLPLAVVLPESTAEVQAIVELCVAHETPFLPRGAGTCLSGGPTPTAPAVILATSRMRRVLEICPEDGYAVVQPGVVNLALTKQTCSHGMHYAPDPSSQAVCTIGGNVAENSGGPHCLKYGMTTDHLLGATVVLPDGAVATFGGPAGPRAPHELDLLGLFTGSEGTFGIATEIVVRLQRDPEDLRTLLGAFKDLDSACAATSAIIADGMLPAALEIMDRATIEAVEASVYKAGYPADAGAILLVELDGPTVAVTEEASEVESIFRAHGALRIERAEDEATRKRLWKGRKGAYGAMGRLAPDLYLLDGVVPRTKLVEALQRITKIGEEQRVRLVNFFHAGDGNLHPTISFDGRDPDERERVLAAGHGILETCMDLGGSISGEHGVGLEKLDHVGLMFDENDLEVMARARCAFDPTGLCNPGKVLPERASCAEVGRDPDRVDAVLLAAEQMRESPK